jgi:multidrug efflux pump subunit AcrA (membrane-fusion protein)
VRAGIVIAGVIACGCHGAAHREPREPARTAAVQHGEVVERVVLTGALHAMSAVDLAVPSADQSQLAIRWLVADGAQVKAGDPVLAFDTSPFTSKLVENHTQLRQAEVQFKLFQDACALRVADKQLEVRKQQHAVDRARLQVELPSDLLTERTIQGNKLALTQAEAGLAKAENELATMNDDNALEQRIRQIDLDKTRRSIDAAERAIDALVVKAPRDGVIVIDESTWDNHKFHVGDVVQDGAVIVSLPDLTKPMDVRADLIDVDDGRIGLHTAGTCTLDAYPDDPLPCTVEALAPVARVKEGLASLRRSFSVTLGLGRGDPARLRPGMAVKVELHPRALHTLVIPRGALVGGRDAGGKQARVRLATGELHDVTLAGCDAQSCAVIGGLSEGELVSLDAVGSLGGAS